MAAGVDKSASSVSSTDGIEYCVRNVSHEGCQRERDMSHPSQTNVFHSNLQLTSLFYAGNDETDLSGGVRGDRGESIIHGAKHLRTRT